MKIQNKVTNASCDRDLILIWLGGKSDTTQVISGSVKQLNVMADGEIGKWGNRERFSLK
jgi:hypothetical protein